MDIDAALRREEMQTRLAAFAREANALNAKPEEVVAVLMDMASRIYAVELAGAENEKQRRRARNAFVRGCTTMMGNLPMASVDARVEAILKARGL